MKTVILGTRSSALALAQVELTRAALLKVDPALEVLVEKFVTQGDQKLDLGLLQSTPGGGKGLFTKELEVALLERRIDVAVHSLKDLPATMPAGLSIGAVLERADTADVLIRREPGGFEGLSKGAKVGTSSVRRARQLQWLRSDLQIVEWRGNVQTRLRKLIEQQDVGGIVLAKAGLDRLGFDTASGQLEFEGNKLWVESMAGKMLPAIGQGAVALQMEEAREDVAQLLAKVNHGTTWTAIRAERELQRLLEGDCTLPVGVRTTVDGDKISMRAILFEEGEKEPREGSAESVDAESVAKSISQKLRP